MGRRAERANVLTFAFEFVPRRSGEDCRNAERPAQLFLGAGRRACGMEFIAVIWHWFVVCLLGSPARDRVRQSNRGRAELNRDAGERILVPWPVEKQERGPVAGWCIPRWMSDWLSSFGVHWQSTCLQFAPVQSESSRSRCGGSQARSQRRW